MPDVETFWDSLKCSWSRRLTYYGAAWHKILQANILSCGYDLNDLLYAGPDSLRKCAQRLTNNFWRETLNIFARLTSKVILQYPEMVHHLNILYVIGLDWICRRTIRKKTVRSEKNKGG